MPINFGQLTPIQGPQAIGQAAPQEGIGNFAQNLMSGLQQGSQIAANSQNMAASQQQMDQSKQLFPAQLQQAQNVAEGSSMDLAAKKQAAVDSNQLRQAAAKSEDDYLKAVGQIDPVAKYAFLKSKADYSKALADVADKQADTKSKNLTVQQQTAAAMANIYSAAQQAEKVKPGSGQKVVDIQFSQLDPETQKQLTVAGMNQFNNNNVMLAHSIGMGAIADINDEKNKKNAPTLVKLQGTRDALLAKVNAGTATDQERNNLAELEAGINKEKNPTRAFANPTDVAIGQADAARLQAIQKSNAAIPGQLQTIQSAKDDLAKTPATLLGPVAGFLKLAKLNPNGQSLVAGLNRLTLTAKEQFNMGSQGFTDADRKFVQAINGDISNYKGTLNDLLDRSATLTKHAAAQNWAEEENIQSKGSNFENWKANNPEPEVQMKHKDGTVGMVPAGDVKKAINAGYILND